MSGDLEQSLLMHEGVSIRLKGEGTYPGTDFTEMSSEVPMSIRVDRHFKRPKDASNIGVSGEAHPEMRKAETCPALPF